MAAQMKPETTEKPGALMTREQIKAEMRAGTAGVLPERVKQHMAEVKALNVMVAEIASMNWGKGLSPVMQRAVAEYCRVRGLDCTEIDILGGNIHRNAKYYLRRMSEMLEAGAIEFARHELVHADPRLAEMAKGTGRDAEWAREEISRRTRIRIERGIPDAATGACVWYIKVRGTTEAFSDAKWCGGGTRKGDPVGDQYPIETAITRSARRTMRYLASQIPGLKAVEDELDEAGVSLSEAVKETHKLELAKEAEVRVLDPGNRDRRARSITQAEYGGGEEARVEVGSLAIDETGGAEFQDDRDIDDSGELALGDTRRNTRIAD